MTHVAEPTQGSPTSGRILELDALRGIAALGVVFWHYGAHFHAYPLAGLLHPFYNAGFLLVDFFFVLSGYVIARAYWREPRQWNFYRNVWARVARLYPLHLLTLLATIMLVASAARQREQSRLPATHERRQAPGIEPGPVEPGRAAGWMVVQYASLVDFH